MTEQALAEAVAELRHRRLEALRGNARRDIALRLLNQNGSVTVEEIDEAFAAEWTDPDEQGLAAMVAAKASASVDYQQRELDAAHDAVARAEEKVAKFEELLASARAALEVAEEQLGTAEEEHADAVRLAEYAARSGDPAAAPPPTFVAAHAGVAAAEGSV